MVINRALLKYDYSNFSFEIIEYCEKAITLERENYYLKTLKPDYNVSVDAAAPMLGRKHTEETIEKLRQGGAPKKVQLLLQKLELNLVLF